MENNTLTKESKMKTQKQLKLLAIESFVAGFKNIECRIPDGLNDEEKLAVHNQVATFIVEITNRFNGSASKRRDRIAAKAAKRQGKLAAMAAKVQAKADAKQAKDAAKLERDTARAAKLAAKLEKLQPVKATFPEDEMVTSQLAPVAA